MKWSFRSWRRLPTKLQSTPQTAVPRSYFSEEVRKQLLNETNILGDDQQTRYNMLYRGGLRTTLVLVAAVSGSLLGLSFLVFLVANRRRDPDRTAPLG